MDPSRITQIIQRIKERIPAVWSIYLYGSQVTNEALPESDLDIALLGPERMPPSKVIELARSTEFEFRTAIDLVDLRAVPTDLQAQIISKGERTLVSEFNQVEVFEDFVYSSYARLNEERRYILADIQKRGSIYAE
jgi:predicted nucleotidyltransferase